MQKEISVSEWATKWIQVATAGRGCSQQAAVKNAICNHVLPVIGSMQLADVQYADTALVMAMVANFSFSLRSKVLINMKGMFEMARRSHVIVENPCTGLKAGPKRQQEKKALTEKQQRALEAAVQGTRAETFVLIGLYTGMRREEILALKWDCVDLEADVPALSVRRALRWEHNQPIVSNALKSAAAKRTIPLPPKLAIYLRSLPVKEGFLVGGTKPLTQAQFKNLWGIIERRTAKTPQQVGTTAKHSAIVRQLDFHVTPHILRHTYITRLVMGGANIKHVQYLAGHSDMKLTLQIYTHLMHKNKEALFADVSAVFNV